MRYGAVSRAILVNTSASFAHGWLIPRLADFHAQHAGIDVQIVTSPDMGVGGLDESHDAIIRRNHPDLRRSGFVSRHLVANRAVPVCSPNLRDRLGLRIPADLARARLLHYSGLPDAWQWWFHNAGVPVSETLGGPYFEQFFLLVQVATSGLGIALASHAVVSADIESGRLVALFPEVELEGPPFHCLYRDAPDDGELTVFLDWLFSAS